MILLSLASKQIWPQVLSVAHLRPDQVFLLHSQDKAESQSPAQRLKRFFDHTGLVAAGKTRLTCLPHDDFNGVERSLDELVASQQLDLGRSVLNFTGGNKLMATAAFRWATRRGLKSFYLERALQLTWFEPRDGTLLTRTDKLDAHLTDDLDPVALLRCQLDASEIERPGQAILLNNAGQQLNPQDFFRRIQSGNDARPWLQITGNADPEVKDGDALEFATAAVLLKLGVKRVQRSLRLKVKSAPHVRTRLPHAEIDLLFTWGGRLWLVDCKDRIPTEDLVANLRRHLPRPLPSEAEQILTRISDELAIGQTKVMKEDLVAVREAGGLLGNVVCIRKARLPEEVVQFARHHGIPIIRKEHLVSGLRNLLFPDQSPGCETLDELQKHFRP